MFPTCAVKSYQPVEMWKETNSKSKILWTIILDTSPNSSQLTSDVSGLLVNLCWWESKWHQELSLKVEYLTQGCLLVLLWLCVQIRGFSIKICSRMPWCALYMHTLVAALSFLWPKCNPIINKNSWWVLGLDEHLLTNLFLNCIVTLSCKLFTWMKR